jgi:hypothetical protein
MVKNTSEYLSSQMGRSTVLECPREENRGWKFSAGKSGR